MSTVPSSSVTSHAVAAGRDRRRLRRRSARRCPRARTPSATTSDASGSSGCSSRSVGSTTVTCVPNRANACASSQPIAPPPMHDERRRRRLGLHRLAVRPDEVGALAQLGQPVDRRQGGRRAGRDHDVPAAVVSPSTTTRTRPSASRPASRPAPRTKSAPAPSSRSTATRSSQSSVASSRMRAWTGAKSGCEFGVAGHALDATRLGQQFGAAQHHLRRDAAVVRALAADQVLVDAEHRPAGRRDRLGNVLATRSQPQHDQVEVGHARHGTGQWTGDRRPSGDVLRRGRRRGDVHQAGRTSSTAASPATRCCARCTPRTNSARPRSGCGCS